MGALVGTLGATLMAALAAGCINSSAAHSQRFDALSLTLTLTADHVASGRTLPSTLSIANASARTVVDPDCRLASYRYGLIRADDAGGSNGADLPGLTGGSADLWGQNVIDCGGSTDLVPGFDETYAGPDFLARTRYGAALAPGNYIAVIEVDGLTGRLRQPVTVT